MIYVNNRNDKAYLMNMKTLIYKAYDYLISRYTYEFSEQFVINAPLVSKVDRMIDAIINSEDLLNDKDVYVYLLQCSLTDTKYSTDQSVWTTYKQIIELRHIDKKLGDYRNIKLLRYFNELDNKENNISLTTILELERIDNGAKETYLKIELKGDDSIPNHYIQTKDMLRFLGKHIVKLLIRYTNTSYIRTNIVTHYSVELSEDDLLKICKFLHIKDKEIEVCNQLYKLYQKCVMYRLDDNIIFDKSNAQKNIEMDKNFKAKYDELSKKLKNLLSEDVMI